jgi:hypothetical protein
MRKKLLQIVMLALFILWTTISAGFGSGIDEMIYAMIDDMYDIAKSTLKYTLTKGDDFLRFIKFTDNVDDIARIIDKLPKKHRLGAILSVCATRGSIKKTQLLKLKTVLGRADDADDILLAALRNGDDVGKIAVTMASGARASAASILAHNMALAGMVKPAFECAAHHIVAFASTKAMAAQRILAKFGIDINDAVNGVWLKSTTEGVGAYHRIIHTGKYYDTVNAMLRQCTTKDECIEVLGKIRQMLMDNTFPY